MYHKNNQIIYYEEKKLLVKIYAEKNFFKKNLAYFTLVVLFALVLRENCKVYKTAFPLEDLMLKRDKEKEG